MNNILKFTYFSIMITFHLVTGCGSKEILDNSNDLDKGLIEDEDKLEEINNEELLDDVFLEISEDEVLCKTEGFILQCPCKKDSDCPPTAFCLKRKAHTSIGTCANRCNPGIDCPENICGEGCPTDKTCECSENQRCFWGKWELYPKCRDRCQNGCISQDEKCFDDTLPTTTNSGDPVCIKWPFEGTDVNSCPPGYFMAAENFGGLKGRCYENPDSSCNTICQPGYACHNNTCSLMCSECDGYCDWSIAPKCLLAPISECSSFSCALGLLPCCDGKRCCQSDIYSNQHGICTKEEDCSTGLFLDPQFLTPNK